jgi:Glycosyl transferase family 11
MIVVRLRGGLGNQLFQYAAGRALAEHHGVALKLDLYTYTRHKYRTFELGNFNIDCIEATRQEVHQYTGSNPIGRFFNKRENYLRSPKVFAQPHYHYYEDFFKLPPDLYLSGYWQSEKYFAAHRDEFLKRYVPRHPMDLKNQEYLEQIQKTNSVGLHVRRGDYIGQQYNQFYGGLQEDYYRKAVSLVKEKIDSPTFFVFSDDLGWCRKNLDLDLAVFVEGNSGVNAFKDLGLMAACQHNVIANSTFSWWGAWLNQNPDKFVVGPRQWFKKSYNEKREPVYPCRYYNTKDLLPGDWTTIG